MLACTSPGGAGGASYPFHEIEHMGREERARHMIPISDTRRDAAWPKANPEQYEQFVALAASDPYADEPGRAMGYRRQLEARAHHDTYDRLAQIACPVMIAAGRFDGIALPATQEKMAARIKGAEAAILRRRPPVHAPGPRRDAGDDRISERHEAASLAAV